jgi:hypothetical protein
MIHRSRESITFLDAGAQALGLLFKGPQDPPIRGAGSGRTHNHHIGLNRLPQRGEDALPQPGVALVEERDDNASRRALDHSGCCCLPVAAKRH